MRRSYRGSMRGGQNWQNKRASNSIPDQLDLQDIDKELELLQRKREIIEQQQQILSNNEYRRNDYQESYRGSNSRYDNVSGNQSYNDYNSGARKRPISVWEDDVPPKRFSGAQASKSRPFVRAAIPPLMSSGPSYRGRYQGSQPTRPLSGPFKPKPQKRDPIPPKNDAIAPRAPTPQKKEPTAPRPAPSKPPGAAAAAAEAPGSSDAEERLCSDRAPHKQVLSRLELALGTIFKEMKTREPSVQKCSASVLRDIKAMLRERIRGVMMGGLVRSADAVVARYREVYNLQSDLDVMTKVLDKLHEDVVLSKLDDPEKFFKSNMQRILQTKLKSLFEKLEEICLAESKPETVDATTTKTEIVPKSEDDKLFQEDMITNSPKYIFLEKWMSNKIAPLLKKFLPYILKIMDIDQKFCKLKNMITSDTVKMLMQKDQHEAGEPNAEAIRSINASLDSSNQSGLPKTPYKPLLHFAKLMGKPGLPKRNQMEKFFAQFQPKSIKKHRTAHSLLFVGFSDKESLDKLLAANGTVIGKFTLSIRISERSSNQKDDVNKELDASTSMENKQESETSTSLDNKQELNASTSSDKPESEFDNQITDLLSTIRKTEENVETNDKVSTNADANIAENTDVIIVENAGADITEKADVKNIDANMTNADIDLTNADADMTNADSDILEITDGVNPTAVTEIIDIADDNEDGGTNVAETKTTDANNGDITESGNNDIDKKKEETSQDDVIAEESADTIKPLDTKLINKSTPARSSARLAATPSRIQTRRASKLT